MLLACVPVMRYHHSVSNLTAKISAHVIYRHVTMAVRVSLMASVVISVTVSKVSLAFIVIWTIPVMQIHVP